jgi:lipopolysaccharide transport system permease protein
VRGAEATLPSSEPRTGAGTDGPTVVVAPPRKFEAFDVNELWGYRELLYFLTRRELLIRYKQSLLGVTWAVLPPIVLALVFALFFGRLANVPSEDLPYPIFALSALVPWVFFSGAVSGAVASLVGDANLLSKVYFPRVVLPTAKICALLVDLVVALVVLVVMTALYGIDFTPRILLVPGFVVVAFLASFGIGVLLAALNVRYRDVGVAVPIGLQIWFFLTPIIYPGSLVGGLWQYVYALNPMVTVINGFRWSLLDTSAPELGPTLVSLAVVLLVLVGGLTYFRRTERFFADII